MFRQVFIPTENDNSIPLVNIPNEWYGREIEILVFPVKHEEKTSEKERLQKREIGFLKGKAEVIFQNDWSMTPEELGMV